ncbi:MAG TPA: bifunctional isocitrate dehydrogenase kinase/phosphatase, partial [Rhodocyclaceae bacterium]|nr:bifunctional isocitrate dehydrogenase kinase/phosphatase [Rhodocyclaceae bacterium]
MAASSSDNLTAESIANVLVDGFNRHYRLFHESSALAKQRFDEARWQEGQQAIRDRIQFYDDRVKETTERLHREFNADSLSDIVWQQAKLQYIGLLTNHKQPELAETFFNSVFCQILHRTYFHNDFIFVRPAVSTEYIESDPPTYRCYYPNEAGFRASIRQVFVDFGWTREFVDLDRDVGYVLHSIEAHLGVIPAREANLQIQVL